MNDIKNIFYNPYLHLILRIILGGMFVVVGIGKAMNPDSFAVEISNYSILPYWAVNFMAIIIPWIELFTGILLLFGIKPKANAVIMGGLLVIFIVAVLLAMSSGLNIDCGCYSNIASQKVGWPKVFENLGLFLICLYLFGYKGRTFSLNKYELVKNDNRNT